MTPAEIRQAAIHAAEVAARPMPADWPRTDDIYDEALYLFVCEGFPASEAVGRKMYEIHQLPFPWPSLDVAPAAVRAWIMTFRAVSESLQPLSGGS